MAPKKKLDLKRENSNLYKPSHREAASVEVPSMNFLMIDGKGDPNTAPEFQRAVEALYGLSYTLKFMVKRGKLQIDYGVMPLEGLWWSDSMKDFDTNNKKNWQWTLMIMQPEWVTKALVYAGREQVTKKKPNLPLDRVRFEPYKEGLSAQIMHIGPFATEGPTIKILHAFITNEGRQRRGKHHEIYLSDFRKAAPAKMKTILRQPMK